MRIVLWNCNNGIGQTKQIQYFKSLNSDLAIVPEIKEKNIAALGPHSFIWKTNNYLNGSPKGLGILSFNGYELKALPCDEEMELYIPIRVSKDTINFNLLAIWNFYYVCKNGRFKGRKGSAAVEYEALVYYRPIFTDPCLVIGDWNLGPTFSAESYRKISTILAESGLHCLYHKHHNLKDSLMGPRTFRPVRGKTLHWLDHMFGSETFIASVSELNVPDMSDVILSDHAPMILDVGFPFSQD